jgi:hypothetical protein
MFTDIAVHLNEHRKQFGVEFLQHLISCGSDAETSWDHMHISACHWFVRSRTLVEIQITRHRLAKIQGGLCVKKKIQGGRDQMATK